MSRPTAVHPQDSALLSEQDTAIAADGPAALAALRAEYAQTALRLGGAREPVAEVQDVVAGGSQARAYRPNEAATPLGAIVWLHGGGWVMGDLEGFDLVCRSLCNASGHVVVSVDYRLAPEHPFPAARDDALAAVDWAIGHGAEQLGYDPGRVVVAGDSAGGNLAAVAARHHADRVAGLVLVYPVTDAAMTSASYQERAGVEVGGLSPESMEGCFAAYLQGADGADPDVSPLRADHAGMPATLVAVAGHDILREDGVAYAAALRAAGVDVELQQYGDMVHGFLRWGGVVDRAGEVIGALADWTRARLR